MPAARLIDTTILVDLTRRDPGRAALAAADCPDGEGYDGVIRFVTLGERRRWPVQASWRAERAAALEAFLAHVAVDHTDDDRCRVWGRLIGTLARAREHRVPGVEGCWRP